MVRSGGIDYYVRDLVPGRSDVSMVAGESAGVWTGGGGAVLGLSGQVSSDDLADVFAGRDPTGDRQLRHERGSRSVAGVDLLFCAPKAVSLLHLLAPNELGAVAGECHQAAVSDAVGYLERTVLGVRRTRSGTSHRLATTGAVAAGFVHRTSRALDPHLHTHLVTANVAQGLDGLWSSLDTRRLFAHRGAMQAVYESSLRHSLSVRTGMAWERRTTGRWDLAGVDPVLERLFSQRASGIEEHVFRTAGGRTSPGLRRAAFHADRPAKERGQTIESLRAGWRRRAADLGLDTGDLVRLIGRAGDAPRREGVDRSALSAHLERSSLSGRTVSARDLVAAVAESAPAGMASAEVEHVVAALGHAAHKTIDPSATAADRAGPHRGDHQWSAGDLVRVLRDPPRVVADALDRSANADRRAASRTREDRSPVAREVGSLLPEGTEVEHRRSRSRSRSRSPELRISVSDSFDRTR